MGILQAQQTAGLPAAQSHDSIDEFIHKCHRAVMKEEPQEPDQDIFIRSREDQAGHDDVLHNGCLQMVILKDQAQLLMQPRQQGLEEGWVVPEKGCPGVGLEPAHWSPRHVPSSPWWGCCRAVGGLVDGD